MHYKPIKYLSFIYSYLPECESEITSKKLILITVMDLVWGAKSFKHASLDKLLNQGIESHHCYCLTFRESSMRWMSSRAAKAPS